MLLSAQSIRVQCSGDRPMIHPFRPDKIVVSGKSAGLSAASYDCSIDHDLTLGVHPGVILRAWLVEQDLETWRGRWRALVGLHNLVYRLHREPPSFALAYTVEDFDLPADISGAVCDKSSYARMFVSAFNTFFDPGFRGNATLELVNLGDRRVTYQKGDPVCQFLFTWLDQSTERPYTGKYQHQAKAPNAARFEHADGSHTVLA